VRGEGLENGPWGPRRGKQRSASEPTTRSIVLVGERGVGEGAGVE
jgi:hypothetical protein